MRNEPKPSDPGDFVFADILTAPERRGHDRQITIFRLAKLKSQKSEGWGFIKNLSTTGMMLEVHSDFDLGDRVQVILSDDNQLVGNVKWRRDELAGIQFSEAVDIAEVLKMAPTTTSGKTARLPRVQMRLPIKIRLGALSIDADICDISPAGMCLKTDRIFEPGKHVTLLVPQLAEIGGTVRWQSHDRAGIAFRERLSIPDIMNWLSTYYNAPVANGVETSASDPDATIEPVPAPATYHILGHDELGRKIPIAILQSASLALLNVKATAKFFGRVSVANEFGVELSLMAVQLMSLEEKQKFEQQPTV